MRKGGRGERLQGPDVIGADTIPHTVSRSERQGSGVPVREMPLEALELRADPFQLFPSCLLVVISDFDDGAVEVDQGGWIRSEMPVEPVVDGFELERACCTI